LKKQGQRQKASDPGLLYRGDIPKTVKKKPKKHEQGVIDKLLENADDDQKDYLSILQWTGFRDGEIEVMLYSDFNFRTHRVEVLDKPQFDFHPKDWEERPVTLPAAVVERIKARMLRPRQYADGFRLATVDDLVFPNSEGARGTDLIAWLHKVAAKAGLDLKGKRAGHMFRKTAGSRVARQQGLPAAMAFLGHNNLKTTALYLACDENDEMKEKEYADAAFAGKL
jgi:integrase